MISVPEIIQYFYFYYKIHILIIIFIRVVIFSTTILRNKI